MSKSKFTNVAAMMVIAMFISFGCKGDPGPVGPTGSTGPVGPVGSAGTNGAQGLPGEGFQKFWRVGDAVSRYIQQTPSPLTSTNDVTTRATFDKVTGAWSLEMKRSLAGADPGTKDYNFTGLADVYFSVAITENSHNHSGDELVLLDFGGTPGANTVAPTNLTGGTAPTIDGAITTAEWPTASFSNIAGTPQLSDTDFPAAVNVTIKLAAAYDATNIYFAAQWVDPERSKSIFKGQWQVSAVDTTTGNPGTPTWKIRTHATKSTATEDEDRLFLMFPIGDVSNNFIVNGTGCQAYCHAPTDMWTNNAGDFADLWHWKAARGGVDFFAQDGFIDNVVGNGRHSDSGAEAFANNINTAGNGPSIVHFRDPGRNADFLYEDSMVQISHMKPIAYLYP